MYRSRPKGRSLPLRPGGPRPYAPYLAERQEPPHVRPIPDRMFRYHAAEGRYPRASPVRHRVFARRTPARRRGDRVAMPSFGPRPRRSELQLNSIGDEVSGPRTRGAHRVLRSTGSLDRTSTASLRDNRPALDSKDDACRAVAKRREDHRSAVRSVSPHFDGVQAVRMPPLSCVLEPTPSEGSITSTKVEFVSPGLSPQQATLFGGGIHGCPCPGGSLARRGWDGTGGVLMAIAAKGDAPEDLGSPCSSSGRRRRPPSARVVR